MSKTNIKPIIEVFAPATGERFTMTSDNAIPWLRSWAAGELFTLYNVTPLNRAGRKAIERADLPVSYGEIHSAVMKRERRATRFLLKKVAGDVNRLTGEHMDSLA